MDAIFILHSFPFLESDKIQMGNLIFFQLSSQLYFCILDENTLVYFHCSRLILYQIIHLYLIHILSTKDIKIPEILPDFIIQWLKDIQNLIQDEQGKKWLKQTSYNHLVIYLILLIVSIILL